MANFFENACMSRLGFILGVFLTSDLPKPQIFFARTFAIGDRGALFYLFGWVCTQKQGIRVRSFGAACVLVYYNRFRGILGIFFAYDCPKVPSLLARAFSAHGRPYLPRNACKNKVLMCLRV